MQPMKTLTENDAIAFDTTGNQFLDLFATIGSARGEQIPEFVQQFQACYAADPKRALRILFWTRDIRGGAGAREVFRQIIIWMTHAHPNEVIAMVEQGVFEHFGRWDDILTAFEHGTVRVRAVVAKHIEAALKTHEKAKITLEKLNQMSEEECSDYLERVYNYPHVV
jgi:hypothetical protein